MTDSQTRSSGNAWRFLTRDHRHVVALTVLIGTLIRLPQLGFVLGDSNDFRKTQTAFVARKFFRDGIDLLSYPLPVFGSSSGVPMEMPIFQAGAALFQHLGVSEDASGQLLSLIMFQISTALAWVLCKRWFNANTALVSVVLLQVIPYSMEWGTAFLIESTALAFSLATLVLIDGWVRHRRVLRLIVATLFASLAFLTKITTPIGWLVGIMLRLLLKAPQSTSLPKKLLATWPAVLVSSLGLAVGILWTSFADSIKEGHPITTFLTSSSLSAWNFGTLQQRVDPYIYVVFGARTWLEIMGFALLLIPIVTVRLINSKSFEELKSPLVIATAVCFGPLVFFNIFQHDYYFLAILPGMTMLTAWVIVKFSEQFFASREKESVIGIVIALILTLWTSFWGARDIHSAFVSPKQYELAKVIAANTNADSRLLMIGCDWNPTLLYYADREGLMIPDWYLSGDYFRTGKNVPNWGAWSDRMTILWGVEDIRTYSFLVTCDSRSRDLQIPTQVEYRPVVDGFLYAIIAS